MQFGRRTAAGLTAVGIALALSACTSDNDDETETAAEQTLEGTVPDTLAWWCATINADGVMRGLIGDAHDSADTSDEERQELLGQTREVLRKNDADGWECEVVVPVDGGPETEEIYTFGWYANDQELIDQMRADALANEADPVPATMLLGETYLWDGRIVSIMPCYIEPPAVDVEREAVPVVFIATTWREEAIASWSQIWSDLQNDPDDVQVRQRAGTLAAPMANLIQRAEQSNGCQPNDAEESFGFAD